MHGFARRNHHLGSLRRGVGSPAAVVAPTGDASAAEMKQDVARVRLQRFVVSHRGVERREGCLGVALLAGGIYGAACRLPGPGRAVAVLFCVVSALFSTRVMVTRTGVGRKEFVGVRRLPFNFFSGFSPCVDEDGELSPSRRARRGHAATKGLDESDRSSAKGIADTSLLRLRGVG